MRAPAPHGPCWCAGDRAALKRVIYHLQCAVITRGCYSAIEIDGPPNIDLHHLDPAVPEDRRVSDLLAGSGWRLDYGRWVCGNHEPRQT